MAKQIIINVKANTANAQSELDQIKAEIQKLNKDTIVVGDTSKKEFKKFEKSAIGAADSTKKLGTATKKTSKRQMRPKYENCRNSSPS